MSFSYDPDRPLITDLSLVAEPGQTVAIVGPTGEVMALNCGSAAFVFTEDKLRGEIAPALIEMAKTLAREIGGHVPHV